MKLRQFWNRHRQIVYGGWFPAKPQDRRKWRQRGIGGRLIYNAEFEAFEYAETTPQTVQRLLCEGLMPNPYSWTAYWADTNVNLPRKYQLWGGAPVQM